MASQNDREMKIVILLLAAALLILGAVAVAAASDRTDRMPVAVFDLRRYMGTWYEIARYDHSFERRLAGVQAHYELLSDGRVTVENSGVDYRSDRRKRARGKARACACLATKQDTMRKPPGRKRGREAFLECFISEQGIQRSHYSFSKRSTLVTNTVAPPTVTSSG